VDFGRGLTDAEIIKALKCAQAYDFVFEGEEGLSKRLAPRGADLSGGQKQRLYIARALAASPAILVLDDSSSALDYQTDASLRRDIREMYPETTVVCIAQRVSSVHSANLILCLDEGRSVGLGTHDELMRSCEIYRETAQLQMGGEE
jgi:ATP-binding cassette subfamily B multidrug efflux pump